MNSPTPLLGAVCTALLLGAVDHRTGRMPNWMNACSLVMALNLNWAPSQAVGLAEAGWGILAGGFAPATLFYFTRGEGIGGGDVKTLMVLGAWLGPDLGVECQLLGFILLAVTALLRAVRRGQAAALLKRSVLVSTHFRAAVDGVPGPPFPRTQERLGPYLACSTTLCCLHHYLTHHVRVLQLLG